ncbi:MAG: hypothetical protein PVJ63_07915 [Thioalkalispiraceae bacterium]|jgi:hypothetical protein
MKIIFASIFILTSIILNNAEAEGICATEQCEKAEKIHELPADVKAFVETRDGCDYFRSEPWPEGDNPHSKDRRQFILRNLKETCTGTDIKLRELRNKYHDNHLLNNFLKGYEDRIEQK